MPADAAATYPFSAAVLRISEDLLTSLRRHPRSYLTLHIGPLLAQHPDLWEALLPGMRQGIQVWADGYAALMADLGVELRPGWTPDRLALALQAALDGFLLRYRIQPEDYMASTCQGAAIFADTVLAIILGVVDADGRGTSGRDVLDEIVERSTRSGNLGCSHPDPK